MPPRIFLSTTKVGPYQRQSLVLASSRSSDLPKMTNYTQALIHLGSAFIPDAAIPAATAVPPRTYFASLSRKRNQAFQFLENCSLPDAVGFIKGLVICEISGACPFPGSTSLVIWAFASLQQRPIQEWAPVADWIITHHDNPYSPFNFRRTRDFWETARQEIQDPVAIARRVFQLEHERAVDASATARRHLVRQATQHLRKGVAPASPEARDSVLRALEREAGWPEE
jgi:hypothetical protein